MDKNQFMKISCVLMAMDMKQTNSNELFNIVKSKIDLSDTVYQNNKTPIECIRQEWRSFLRTIYRSCFFKNNSEYKDDCRDILRRRQLKNTSMNSQLINSLIVEEYHFGVELLADKLTDYIFVGYHHIKQKENDENKLILPSKLSKF